MSTLLRNADARRRLWRRAVGVLAEHADHDHLDASLEHAAWALAERGIAATTQSLDDHLDALDTLAALEADDVDRFVDLDRFHGTRDEAREWLEEKMHRTIRSVERRACG